MHEPQLHQERHERGQVGCSVACARVHACVTKCACVCLRLCACVCSVLYVRIYVMYEAQQQQERHERGKADECSAHVCTCVYHIVSEVFGAQIAGSTAALGECTSVYYTVIVVGKRREEESWLLRCFSPRMHIFLLKHNISILHSLMKITIATSQSLSDQVCMYARSHTLPACWQ